MTQLNQRNRLSSFKDFWPYYVREHAHPVNRILHFIGSTLGLVCLALAFSVGSLWLLPTGLVFGYGFAWVGHFFIEHNKPATFQHPIWSLCADWKMWFLMLTGRMQPEVRRAIESA